MVCLQADHSKAVATQLLSSTFSKCVFSIREQQKIPNGTVVGKQTCITPPRMLKALAFSRKDDYASHVFVEASVNAEKFMLRKDFDEAISSEVIECFCKH
ncbi:hypothetical protein PoB_002363000 [Plakobranchus ocellatus]|uniref:Uncharacterized protein n=1 Tax=Plakobranchus ocellatus TaxID=259542 RepID=A0AAV3ZPP5_9GAST|nr:hypothetical protein PoB_002363000 [Plakobranchus ocellatus]